MNFSYSKKDKLKSKKLIEQLFSEGKAISAFPLRLVYLKTMFDDDSVKLEFLLVNGFTKML